MDTQWPRFEVFEQERPDRPHQNAGAVHAPDAELALLNARDVFVRRPDCYSLWVAPANAIYSRTAEELASTPASDGEPSPDGPVRLYQVFIKTTQRQGQNFVTHLGAVEAQTPADAIRLAVERFSGPAVFVWWVIADSAIARSAPGDADSLFAPARDKHFRMPNFYRVQTLLREVTGGEPAAFDPGAAPAESPASVAPPGEPLPPIASPGDPSRAETNS